jgi:hypothetical protein
MDIVADVSDLTTDGTSGDRWLVSVRITLLFHTSLSIPYKIVFVKPFLWNFCAGGRISKPCG